MVSSIALAQVNRDERTDKQKDMIQTDNPTKAFEDQKDVIHHGMTKPELYKLFPKENQIGHSKKGSKEWIYFTDPDSKDANGKIAVYLKNSKVISWKKQNKQLKKIQDELDKLNNQT